MGYVGRLEDKLKAQALRRKGLSYREILQQIKVSKDTISRWCRDIPLTKKQKERLIKKKVFGQRKGSIVAAENKRKIRTEKWKTILRETKKELGILSKRDRFMAGLALYAGEGNKSEHHGGFTNANPKIVKFIFRWLHEFCNLPISKLRGAIWLHENLNENEAREFWSRLTDLPMTQFYKTYIAKNKKDSKKIRKNIHQFGVFAVKFSDIEKQRRILGWISALLNGKIKAVH